jgi:hypothetical protein
MRLLARTSGAPGQPPTLLPVAPDFDSMAYTCNATQLERTVDAAQYAGNGQTATYTRTA